MLRNLVILCCLVTFLCTCDRAPDPLFRVRTDTGVMSTNQLQETEDFNIIEYLYYYNGGGVAATDISGDGLPDLYFTNNQGPNKYYINEGDFKFRDATEEGAVAGAGDWSTGISVVDINQDGRMDLYVCNVSGYKGLEGKNELFIQQTDGTFVESAADYGLDFAGFNTQAYWFDYDLDGDLDMYLLRHSVHNDATYGTAEGREVPDSLAGDLLLRNDLNLDSLSESPKPLSRGEGLGRGFSNVTTAANLFSSKIAYGLSAAIADFNQDSFPDIYVCNDFSENDYYYINQQDGTFRESVRELTGHTTNFSMGSDVGYFDGDRWPDLFTLDMRPNDESILKSTMSSDQPNVYNLKRKLGYYDQLPHNALQWNRGNGNFSEVAEMAGVAASDWSWSCLIEDFDLDRRPDIFIANGIERRPNSLDFLKFISSGLARRATNLEVLANMPDGHVPNQAYRQTGNLTFEEVAADWGLDLNGSSTGAAVADFDQDGDADLVLNNLNAPATIYENVHQPKQKSMGASFNPVTQSPARYDPDRLICPQRGMMSQSEGSYGSIYGTAAKYRKWYTVKPSGIVRPENKENFFDREPLVMAAPRGNGYPVMSFDGGIAIPSPSRTTFTVYRWNGQALDSVETLALPPLHYKYELFRPDKALEANFPAQEESLYAEAFGSINSWKGGDVRDPLGFPTGLWQSLTTVSGDGGPETTLIAGNWGLNSTLGTATKEAPVRLYEADFDGNGKKDPLYTYVRNGQEMTVADKDELAGQIPSFRRNNLSYTDFARRSFGENFPDLSLEPETAETLHHLRLTRLSGLNWKADTLPMATQITTVNCAWEMKEGILLGGNKQEVLPRIGRQDAAALQLLRDDHSLEFIDLGGANNRLEVRQLVPLDDRHVLIVVAAGEHLILGW
ncbi:FG-GAP repeat domain-containing protein [Neolewinella agarilytica]|uniref:Repeat domain-containing protein n=1 Tax=Neolewinella agarilytica TaxID=478744 RepID=A0A1H9L1Q3_9BACT|nr:VCBS repeat-containing protein [Neolewinella agarilytica]SER05374.1 Repeat domain-containing protein [Neolewinella agarilytica]